MDISDWISIGVAFITLVATIVIGRFQICQNKRLSDFEHRQDKRDETRHAASVKSQAVSFISKNYSNRGLIPLCAIAAMHNDLYYYSREMYREFCCMTMEVQNCILEYCKLDLRVIEESNIFKRCTNEVEKVFNDILPQEDDSPFYDNFKYISNSLDNFGSSKIPTDSINIDNKFSNCLLGDTVPYYHYYIDEFLSASFSGDNYRQTISELEEIYSFKTSKEIEACQFVTTLAMRVAIYGGKDNGKRYGCPGSYDGENIDNMEDLFLLSLFEMYTRLVLK